MGVVCVQEGKRSVASSLGIVAGQELLEALALGSIIRKSDVHRQVRAGIESARSLSTITGHEGVLENPVGAGFWCLEAASCAIAGALDAVTEEEVDLGHDTSDVDATVVADAAAIVGGCLESGEFALGDVSFADGVLVV